MNITQTEYQNDYFDIGLLEMLEEEGHTIEIINPIPQIRLEQGQFGTYLVVNIDTGEDVLIQSDIDFPSIAIDFGWSDFGRFGNNADISAAIEYLDENIGATVDDPGYFECNQ